MKRTIRIASVVIGIGWLLAQMVSKVHALTLLLTESYQDPSLGGLFGQIAGLARNQELIIALGNAVQVCVVQFSVVLLAMIAMIGLMAVRRQGLRWFVFALFCLPLALGEVQPIQMLDWLNITPDTAEWIAPVAYLVATALRGIPLLLGAALLIQQAGRVSLGRTLGMQFVGGCVWSAVSALITPTFPAFAFGWNWRFTLPTALIGEVQAVPTIASTVLIETALSITGKVSLLIGLGILYLLWQTRPRVRKAGRVPGGFVVLILPALAVCAAPVALWVLHMPAVDTIGQLLAYWQPSMIPIGIGCAASALLALPLGLWLRGAGKKIRFVTLLIGIVFATITYQRFADGQLIARLNLSATLAEAVLFSLAVFPCALLIAVLARRGAFRAFMALVATALTLFVVQMQAMAQPLGEQLIRIVQGGHAEAVMSPLSLALFGAVIAFALLTGYCAFRLRRDERSEADIEQDKAFRERAKARREAKKAERSAKKAKRAAEKVRPAVSSPS